MSSIAWIVFTGIVLISCAPTGVTSPLETQAIDAELRQIADEFRELRALRGQFDGGAWNEDIDRWMGRKHQLMLQLAARLGDDRFRFETIAELLGPPDYTVQEGDELFELIGRSPDGDASTAGNYRYLVYTWRGTHDFMFFISDDSRVTGAGWWHAGE